MSLARILRSEEGFSLLEIMIAAAMSGMILLMAAAGMFMFSTGSLKLNRGAMQQVSHSGMGAQFLSIVESAGVAVEYQHLPIRVTNDNCAGNTSPQPRVRIRSGDSWSCPNGDSNVAGLASEIEFFRDMVGALRVTQVGLDGSGGGTADLISQQRMTYGQGILDGDYYVTWPLKDETSPPFLILRNADDDLSFNMLYCGDYITVPARQETACVGTTTNLQLQSNKATTASAFQGSPMLFYNSKDPKQFIVLYLQSADVAAGSGNTRWNVVLASMSTVLVAPYVANAASLGYTSATIPSWGSASTTDGNTQDPSLYQFPTDFPSGQVWSGSESMMRNIARFFDSKYSLTDLEDRPRWIGVPLRMTAIYLLAQPLVPAGCPRNCAATIPLGCPVCDNGGVMRNYRLMSSTRVEGGTSVEVTLADHVFGAESSQFVVMIARKLGQAGIEIFTSNQR